MKQEVGGDSAAQEKRVAAVAQLARHAPLPAGVDADAVFAPAADGAAGRRKHRDEPYPETAAAFNAMARAHNERVLAAAGFGVNGLGNVTLAQGCAVVCGKRGRGAVGADKLLRIMRQQESSARR